MSSSTNKYQIFKNKLAEARFRKELLDDPAAALKSIGITETEFINVIKDLVQSYESDPSEHKEAVGAGPIEGKQGYRFYPI